MIIVGEDEFGLFLSGEALTGGWGAYEGGDGESALIHSAAGDFKNFPIETMEHRYPLIMRRHGLREGSGGDGKWRGGMGIVREYEILAPVTIQLWFERAVQQPSWGLFGGQDGLPPEVWVHRPGEEPEKMHKANDLKVEPGTRLVVKTGGGGGWGDPAERAAEDRAKDRRLELVT